MTFDLNSEMETHGVLCGKKDERKYVARTYDHKTLVLGDMKYDDIADHYVFESTPKYDGVYFEFLINKNYIWKKFQDVDDFGKAVFFFNSFIARYEKDGDYYIIEINKRYLLRIRNNAHLEILMMEPKNKQWFDWEKKIRSNDIKLIAYENKN